MESRHDGYRLAMNPEQFKPALAKARKALVAGLRPLYDEEFANPTDMPPRLFHFTDVEGLVGIIQSRTLRASLAYALNDPSEVSYGTEVARTLLDSHRVHVSPEFSQKVAALLDPANAQSLAPFTVEPYLVAFCDSADQAIHWLHYGRSGYGLAIAFDAAKLASAVDGQWALFRVVYDLIEQRSVVVQVVETASRIAEEQLDASGHSPFLDAGVRDLAAYTAATFIRVITPRFKNPAYKAEREWRLASIESNRRPDDEKAPVFRFRCCAGRVVPFLDIPLTPAMITDIVLGWSSPMSPGDVGLHTLVREALGKEISIVRSEVPVRM